MKLFDLLAWMLLAAVVTVIAIAWFVDQLSDINAHPTATRYEVVDGQQVPFWPTAHRGEPVRIYQCPGQPPQIALAQAPIDCPCVNCEDPQ